MTLNYHSDYYLTKWEKDCCFKFNWAISLTIAIFATSQILAKHYKLLQISLQYFVRLSNNIGRLSLVRAVSIFFVRYNFQIEN